MKKIAVSACLLGHKVRYDGRSKKHALIKSTLSKLFQIVPVCPEVEAGFSVPREAMHLIQKDTDIKAVLVNNPDTDLTAALNNQAENWLEKHSNISGLIVKSRSPSCAYKTAVIESSPDHNQATGSGLFTAYICQKLPNLPVIDDEAILSAEKLNHFLASIEHYKAGA